MILFRFARQMAQPVEPLAIVIRVKPCSNRAQHGALMGRPMHDRPAVTDGLSQMIDEGAVH